MSGSLTAQVFLRGLEPERRQVELQITFGQRAELLQQLTKFVLDCASRELPESCVEHWSKGNLWVSLKITGPGSPDWRLTSDREQKLKSDNGSCVAWGVVHNGDGSAQVIFVVEIFYMHPVDGKKVIMHIPLQEKNPGQTNQVEPAQGETESSVTDDVPRRLADVEKKLAKLENKFMRLEFETKFGVAMRKRDDHC